MKQEITFVFRSSVIPIVTLKDLIPRDSVAHRLYRLAKTHKPDIPRRPIVSTIGSSTYYPAKYLARLLKPLRSNSSCHVLSSTLISYTAFDPCGCLVSFGVTYLFIKVSVNVFMTIIRQSQRISFLKRSISNKLMELLFISFKYIKICFNGSV